MRKVEVIKANKKLIGHQRGREHELLRVAAYCRVSTDGEEQINSYNSQVKYYTEYIQANNEWTLVDIYADEAVSGTQTLKRDNFNRLINDCMNGKIDMVITKSIPRFARNTLDTLKFVRMLKEKNIAVFFENEKINTLTKDGELLLVVISSVAQQEVENTSMNLKKGLKMKMSRGELVGFQSCLGYDYVKETKSIVVNEEEAEIVRYIFQRYIDGLGGRSIGKELENLGYKTKRGSKRWVESTVLGIIKNEKYKGDLLQGKTITLDPITHRRVINFGEEDQYYIKNNHEPIISEEIFSKAEEIRLKRSQSRQTVADNGGKRQKFSRKYSFSCMIKCGFCGANFVRRTWHGGTQYHKVFWHCGQSTKNGKENCPHSKGISEEAIEKAFVESYRIMCSNNKEILEEFLYLLKESLGADKTEKDISTLKKSIKSLKKKKSKLIDFRLDELIGIKEFEDKVKEIDTQLNEKLEQKNKLEQNRKNELNIKDRMIEFKKVLSENEILPEFNRSVFESVVDHVIVGGKDETGNINPELITFVYKTGLNNTLNGKYFKPKRKNAKRCSIDLNKSYLILCSQASDKDEKLYPHACEYTRGDSYASS